MCLPPCYTTFRHHITVLLRGSELLRLVNALAVIITGSLRGHTGRISAMVNTVLDG